MKVRIEISLMLLRHEAVVVVHLATSNTNTTAANTTTATTHFVIPISGADAGHVVVFMILSVIVIATARIDRTRLICTFTA